jgi:hypothetical protein
VFISIQKQVDILYNRIKKDGALNGMVTGEADFTADGREVNP